MLVYSAIIGPFDSVKTIPLIHQQIPNCDFRMYGPSWKEAHKDEEPSIGWTMLKVHKYSNLSPVRASKRYKITPEQWIASYNSYFFSLWLDGSIEIITTKFLGDLIPKYLGEADLCVFRHPHGDCCYQEAKGCLDINSELPGSTGFQVKRYREAGLKEHAGLYENGVILRRLSSKMEKFNTTWMNEIQNGTHRDQVSLPYALMQHPDINVNFFPGGLSTNKNELFKVHPHARR